MGGGQNKEASWTYNDEDGNPLDHVRVSPSSSIFFMWRAWREHGQLPVKGDYSDQPICLMAQIEALEMVANTRQITNSNDSDWSTLTADQIAMMRWLDKVKVN